MKKGLEKGEDKGLVKGLQKGEAFLLGYLLATRFGALNDEARERLNNASTQQLETWATRIFDAPDLQSVFKSN